MTLQARQAWDYDKDYFGPTRLEFYLRIISCLQGYE